MSRLLVIAGALVAFAATAAVPVELKSLKVERTGTSTIIRVEASATPVFTVFRLQDPDRLVVDLTGARKGALSSHYEGQGPVAGVVVAQFAEKDAEVARLLVGLDGATSYDVRADGQVLIVRVDGPIAPASPAPAEASAGASAVTAPALPEVTVPRPTEPESRVNEVAVKRPGRLVQAVTYSRGLLSVKTDGEVRRIEELQLEEPPRLVFDLVGFSGPVRIAGGRDSLVRDVRVGASGQHYRVVVEGAVALSGTLTRNARGFSVRVTARSADAPASEVVIDGRPVALNRAETLTEVQAVTFKEAAEAGTVEVKLSGAARWKVERPDGRTAALTLEGVRLPRSLERSLDTTDLGTVATMVSTFSQPEDRVRIVVAGREVFEDRVVAKAGVLQWRISPGTGVEKAVAESRTSGLSVESDQVAVEGAPQRARYVGKKVSFEFKDIDIHNLLRIIADISKKNIVVSDDVSGKVTIRLRNVPWDQALELVLRSKSLGQEDLGNIIRVAPLAKLEEESKQRAERRKNERLSRDLSVQLVPVNYATAGDMATRVKEILSERGNVAVDTRTNTLIVRDLPENMGRVRSLVASLDLQTPQVLIEARIVEVATRRQREIGIQWGGQAVMSQATGNPTGLQFPSTVAATGGVPIGANAGVSTTPNYAVSLPVGVTDGSGGAIGLVFGSAGSAATLNLRLSALESQGVLRTLSAPRVTTLNNQQARIAQGTSLPFSQTSAAGANTVFIDSILQLNVTPHITADGSVLMSILASNNQPDPANTGANGQPAISRKEAQTNVLVPDGDTTVIGGIYVIRNTANTSGLPLLSKIPIIGFFFRNNRELETKDELLFFITPRILNRQTMAQKL
jgi:type IV pilus assembly protein PilQ